MHTQTDTFSQVGQSSEGWSGRPGMNLSQQFTLYHPIWVLTTGTLSVSTSRSPRSLCPFLCSPAPPQHAGVFCSCLMSIKSNKVGTYLRMQQVRNLMPSKAVKPHTQIHHIVVTFHHFHPQIIRSETWTSFKIQQNLRILRILAGPNYRDPLLPAFPAPPSPSPSSCHGPAVTPHGPVVPWDAGPLEKQPTWWYPNQS